VSTWTGDAGNCPSGLAIHDVNGDGRPDLLVSNNLGDLLLLKGKGDGTFEPLTRVGQNNVALAVADFNRDGQIDTAAVQESTDQLTVWLANGEVYFAQGGQSGLAAPRAVTAADLNQDGWQDLVIANGALNNVLVYLGRPSGGFENPRSFAVGTQPAAISVADLNGDRLPDLVVANEESNDVSVWLGDSDPEVLLRPGPRPDLRAWDGGREVFGLGPVSVDTPDMNGDGLTDLLVSNAVSHNTFLFSARGGGFFADPVLFSSSGNTGTGRYTGSLGGESYNDLVVFDRPSGSMWWYDDANPGAGVVPFPKLEATQGWTLDFNRDGFDDLVTASLGDGTISLLLGSPNGFDSCIDTLADLPPLAAIELTGFLVSELLAFECMGVGDDHPTMVTVSLPQESQGGLPPIVFDESSPWVTDLTGPVSDRNSCDTAAPSTEASTPQSVGESGSDSVTGHRSPEPEKPEEPPPPPPPPDPREAPEPFGNTLGPEGIRPDGSKPDGTDGESEPSLTPAPLQKVLQIVGRVFPEQLKKIVEGVWQDIGPTAYVWAERLISALGLEVAPDDLPQIVSDVIFPVPIDACKGTLLEIRHLALELRDLAAKSAQIADSGRVQSPEAVDAAMAQGDWRADTAEDAEESPSLLRYWPPACAAAAAGVVAAGFARRVKRRKAASFVPSVRESRVAPPAATGRRVRACEKKRLRIWSR
jgi:hypothetical protein